MQGVHCDLVPSCGSSSMDSWLAGIAMQFKHEARYSKDARKNCPPCTISAPPASAQLHRRGQRTAAHRAKHPDDGLHERRLRWLRPREEPLVQPRPDHTGCAPRPSLSRPARSSVRGEKQQTELRCGLAAHSRNCETRCMRTNLDPSSVSERRDTMAAAVVRAGENARRDDSLRGSRR